MKVCVSCGHGLTGSDWSCNLCGWRADVNDGILSLAKASVPSAGFSPSQFESLYALEHKHFWFRSRIRLILWALKRYAHQCRSFLEVGCGTGAVLSAVTKAHPDLQVWGSEAYMQGLRLARTRVDSTRLLQMDARLLPFSEEFDAIGLFDVIEHIEEDEKVLSEVGRALKPEGTMLITVPQHRFLWSAADEDACHVRRYTRAELTQKVQQARFQVVLCTSFVSILFPLLLISRLGQRRWKQNPLAEYRLPSLANQLLEWALTIERLAIRMGATFPFGGSLLLVARKAARS